MSRADRLEADAAQIRRASQAVAAAAGHLEDVPGALARTATGIESALPGSATASTWRRLGRHCAIAADAEGDNLIAFRDLIVAAADRYADVERQLVRSVTRGRPAGQA